jgi:hypothetical protein
MTSSTVHVTPSMVHVTAGMVHVTASMVHVTNLTPGSAVTLQRGWAGAVPLTGAHVLPRRGGKGCTIAEIQLTHSA